MKNFLLSIVVIIAAGCAAYVTPSGTYIEPLSAEVVIGSPVVVAPPRAVVVAPLPPVIVVPGRHLYFHRGFYYYNWSGGWYWSRERRGPWHELPRKHWPSKTERREPRRDRDKPSEERGRGRY